MAAPEAEVLGIFVSSPLHHEIPYIPKDVEKEGGV